MYSKWYNCIKTLIPLCYNDKYLTEMIKKMINDSNLLCSIKGFIGFHRNMKLG